MKDVRMDSCEVGVEQCWGNSVGCLLPRSNAYKVMINWTRKYQVFICVIFDALVWYFGDLY